MQEGKVEGDFVIIPGDKKKWLTFAAKRKLLEAEISDGIRRVVQNGKFVLLTGKQGYIDFELAFYEEVIKITMPQYLSLFK